MRVALLTVSLIVGLAILGAAQEAALVDILDAEGQHVASAILLQLGEVTQIDVKNETLPPGIYGVHIHETGRCDAPDFSTAGSHFNPHNKQHGFQNPDGHHAGDLPNLEVNVEGEGTLQWVTDQLTLVSGEADSLFGADGSAIIIHASADDMVTDPSGNSGARIACGIIERVVDHAEEPEAQPQSGQDDQAPAAPARSGMSFGTTEIILGLLALLLLAVIVMRVL